MFKSWFISQHAVQALVASRERVAACNGAEGRAAHEGSGPTLWPGQRPTATPVTDWYGSSPAGRSAGYGMSTA
jgi:hypothetical protein